MKKRTLIVAALLAAMTISANAQENLAQGKTVVVSSNSGNEKNLVDGNDATGWEVATGDENIETGYWLYIDLGSKQKFNTLKIRWERASSHEFDVYTADGLGADETPNFGETPACHISQEISDINETQTYNVGDLEARYIKIKATTLDFSPYWHLFEVGVYNTNYTKVLTNVEAPTYVEAGSQFTINIKDQYGNAMDAESIETSNATKVEGSTNTFKAGENGKIELKVKNGEVEKDVTVWVVPELAETTLKDTDYSFFSESSDDLDMYDTGWEGGYGAVTTMEFAGNKVLEATTVKTFGFKEKNEDNIGTEYKSFNFDIYPTEDVTDGYINFEGSGKNISLPTLKAGEWNHVSIDVTSLGNFKSYIKWKLRSQDGPASTLNILLDNVYFSAADAQLTEEVRVAKETTNGFYAVTGYAKSAKTINDQLTDPTIAAYDLTNLVLDEGTTYDLTPANPNALIYVKGEGGDNWTPSQDWGNTKNLVGFNGDASGYCVPSTKGVSYEDGYAIFTDRTLAAKSDRSFSYTRTIPANAYVSTYLPVGADIPEGCKVYTLAAGEDGKSLNLIEATTLNAETPYFIHNENTAPVTLNISATTDVQMVKGNDHEKEIELGDIAIANGNYSYFAGNGSQYVLDGKSYDAESGTLKLKICTDKTNIVPFRTYFTLKDATKANAVRFVLPGTVTGINDVKANAQKAADIYSVDGRLVKKGATSVNGLASGVYIMNGKKYVVK